MTRERQRTGRGAVVAACGLWALAAGALASVGWFDHLIKVAGRSDLMLLTSDTPAYVLTVLAALTVGALVAGRRPRHPVGWLLLGLGLTIALSALATGYAYYGVLARPGTLPAVAVAVQYQGVSALGAASCLGFVLLLTPTGSLPSPRWRWWARVAVLAPLLGLAAQLLLPFDPPFQSASNPLAVPALAGPVGLVNNLAWSITGLGILVAAGSLVLRLRRARGVERLQLRWLAWGAALTGLMMLALLAALPTGDEVLLGLLTALCIGPLPLATGAAILRYRLYDLDRIISRTLAYGLLTLLLGLGYGAVVLLGGRLLPQGSSLTVAVATLAVAAAFQPARRRVQALVDRRFNRRRYDATRTIQAFSDRLRQQVDLDTLTAELLAVTDQTMQPTRATLWLRPHRG
jgi:hypothetical protein